MEKWKYAVLVLMIIAVMGITFVGIVSAKDLDDGIGFEDEIGFGNDLGKKINILYMKQKGQAKKRSKSGEEDLFGEDSPGNVNSVVVDGNVQGDIIIIDDGK